MQKLDRLGWAAGMSIYAYGRRIGVRSNDPEALRQLEERLPSGWEAGCGPVVDRLYSVRIGKATPGSKTRNFHVIYAGLTRIARTLDREAAYDAFESDVQTYVAQHAANRVFLHAGVVGWNDAAILVPACSFGGKSTFIAALLRHGATYYSDEYAVLDGRGLVHPFARRLSLRRGPAEALLRPTAADLGSTAGEQPMPIGLVAFCEYCPDARWNPRPLSASAAVHRLMNHAYVAERQPEMAMLSIQRALAGAVAIETQRGEADEAAATILRYFDGLPTPTAPTKLAA